MFPGFRDGRAYSQARILRERYGFGGELRATGQVLRDQFLFLLRAGFDSFEVTKEADAAAFAESIRRFDVFYQPTGDGRATAFRRRLGRRVPERAGWRGRSRPVIRVARQDRDGAVELLQQHHPHQLMRPGRRAEADRQV